MKTRPRICQDGLIIRELDEEILIYNTADNKAYCLNRTAAMIWKECDGQSTVEEISNSLSRQVGTSVDERAVWLALKQFDRDRLLEDGLRVPPELRGHGLSRRQVVQAMGIAAVAAVPLITSIVAPTAVQAATCLAPGSVCTTAGQCCSGLCPPNPDGPMTCP
jgi:hypothetical protein